MTIILHWLKDYKYERTQSYCCICGSLTNMKLNQDYLCNGFGLGGLNPSSDAFCHNLYQKKRNRENHENQR